MTDKTLERDTFSFVQIPFLSQWFSEAIWDAKRANVYDVGGKGLWRGRARIQSKLEVGRTTLWKCPKAAKAATQTCPKFCPSATMHTKGHEWRLPVWGSDSCCVWHPWSTASPTEVCYLNEHRTDQHCWKRSWNLGTAYLASLKTKKYTFINFLNLLSEQVIWERKMSHYIFWELLSCLSLLVTGITDMNDHILLW